MQTQEKPRSSHLKTRFRFDLVSMATVALFSVFLVFLLDTGSLAQWIANHKETKIVCKTIYLVKEFENLRVSGILPFRLVLKEIWNTELYMRVKILNYEVIIGKKV